MTVEEIQAQVLKWAEARGLLKESGSMAQLDKLCEEFNELETALYRKYEQNKENAQFDIVDAIGDMMVVLTLIAHFEDRDLQHCYEVAWEAIKDRKGKMVNGLFVKEA